MRVDSVTRLLCLLMLTQRTASYMPGLVGRRGATPLRRASKIAAKAAAAPPKYITDDVGNNVTPYIENLVGRGLHRAEAHPLGIIKAKIEEYFQGLDGPAFEIVDDLDPLVQAQACFDDLLIPKDHPGRLPSDTYYVSRPGGREVSASTDVLLRTHTSAHQSQLLRDGKEAFLCTGDVYRRDEIDASHFPAFHQMEGVKLFPPADVGGAMTREEWLASPGCELIAKDLKKTLEGLCDHLFGDCEKRWIDECAAGAARPRARSCENRPPAPHSSDLLRNHLHHHLQVLPVHRAVVRARDLLQRRLDGGARLRRRPLGRARERRPLRPPRLGLRPRPRAAGHGPLLDPRRMRAIP